MSIIKVTVGNVGVAEVGTFQVDVDEGAVLELCWLKTSLDHLAVCEVAVFHSGAVKAEIADGHSWKLEGRQLQFLRWIINDFEELLVCYFSICPRPDCLKFGHQGFYCVVANLFVELVD